MPLAGRTPTWADHVAAGQAFAAENFVIAAGGLLPMVQLFNPAGSGIRVRLRSVHSVGVSVQIGNIYRHDVPLMALGPPVTFKVENLMDFGSPASDAVAQMRYDQPAAAVGSRFWLLNAPANTPAIYPPEGREWGHDLLPDQGIHVEGGVGTTLIVNWQWVEVPL